MKHTPSRAFTLVELLVVITIIAVLAGLAVPVVRTALQKSKETESAAHLRQLALGMLAHAGDNDGRLMATVAPGNVQWNKSEIGELFQYLEPRENPQNGWNHIKGTIFETPLPTSTNMNRNTYGKNSHLGHSVSSPGNLHGALAYSEIPLSRVQLPASAALILDFRVSNFTITQSSFDDKLEFAFDRYNGKKIQVAFVDGHVEPITREEYTALRYDDDRYLEFLTGIRK